MAATNQQHPAAHPRSARRFRPTFHHRPAPEPPAEPPRRRGIPFMDCGPEAVVAMSSGSVAFQDLVLGFFFGREPPSGQAASPAISAADREQLRDNFGSLVDAFVAEHGSFVRSYFATHCMAAAVLTSQDEIEVVLAGDVPSSELIQIIRRGQALAYTAWHRLEDRDRTLCQRMIFSVILEVLRRLDRCSEASASASYDPRQGKEMSAAELTHLRRNLDDAEDFMLRCATRRAQSRYVHGMLQLGSLLVAPVVVAAIAVGLVDSDFNSLLGQVLLVAIAGAGGAMVSVMWRMTSGTFSINLPTLESKSADSELTLMGALRPLIGSVFALALFVFAKSPLVPLQEASRTDTYLLVALGFLAGFSERFAQDIFVRSGQGLAGPGGDSPSSGLSAGLAPPPGAASGRTRRRGAGG